MSFKEFDEPSFSDLISCAEAGEMIGVSPQTIRAYVRDGLLTGYAFGRNSVRVDRRTLGQLVRPIAAK